MTLARFITKGSQSIRRHRLIFIVCFTSFLGLLFLAGIFASRVGISADGYNATERQLLAVLNDKAVFKPQKGEPQKLSQYTVSGAALKVSQYLFIDLDADGENELLVRFSNPNDGTLVLHQSGNTVFGFQFAKEALLKLKQDGSFLQKDKNGGSLYAQMTFNNRGFKINESAYIDHQRHLYRRAYIEKPSKEVKDYVKRWEQKEDAVWKDLLG